MSDSTATPTNLPTDFIIDLASSSNPHALSAEQFLNVKQYVFLFQRMAETLGKIPSFKDTLDREQSIVGYKRVHDVIAVNGKRGSGKTTFLLSALTLLNNTQELKKFTSRHNIEGIDADRLCVLDVLDPTLFACREHLLHAILCKISQKVHDPRNRYRSMNCNGQDPTCMVEQWEKIIKKLARGLNALGEIREGNEKSVSSSSRWEEASFTMQSEMSTIQSSMDLERCFYGVVRKALEILGKDAFVIALDDIDTRPSIGWHVLEVIRRYLTTPQILVVMSGDLDLLTSIIRREHAQGLGLDVKEEYANKSPYKERLDGLTEQYLLKILRSNARINLGNFISALQSNGLNVLQERGAEKVKITKVNICQDTYTLHEIVDSFFSFIGCSAEKERSLFRHTLMNTSCRTEVQVLDALFDYRRRVLSDDELAFRLCEIYFMQLVNFGLDPLDIQETLQSPQGLTRIMDVLFKGGHATAGLELLPDRMDSYENEALLALHATLVQAMKTDKEMVFSYMFKACWLREVLIHIGLTTNTDYPKITRYLNLNSDKPLSNIAKCVCALLWPNNALHSQRLMNCGTLRITSDSVQKKPSQAIKSMYGVELEDIESAIIPEELQNFWATISNADDTPYKNLFNTPQTLQQRITSWHGCFVPLGMLILRKDNASNYMFSIVSLLSVLGEMLTLDKEINAKDFESFFKKRCYIDDFDVFIDKDKRPIGEEYDTDAENSSLDSDDERERKTVLEDGKEQFFEAMVAWHRNFRRASYQVAPVLLSRVMARFCKALKGIDGLGQSNVFLGFYIHRCLVSFFNSVLVEEVLLQGAYYDNIKKYIRLENPKSNDSIFNHNVNVVLKYTVVPEPFINHMQKKLYASMYNSNLYCLGRACPFFSVLFSCPLWALYLDKESDVWNVYKSCIDDEILCESVTYIDSFGNKKAFNDLYSLMNSIAIPKKIEKNLQDSSDYPRTLDGVKLKLPKNKIRLRPKLINDAFTFYNYPLNSSWKNGDKEVPHDFELSFEKVIKQCYYDSTERMALLQETWDEYRKAK